MGIKLECWNIYDYWIFFAVILIGKVKLIFHCDAKPFALSPSIGLTPHNFTWGYQHVGV